MRVPEVGILFCKPRLSADTSTSESEEEPVENPRQEKKALSPVCGVERTDPGALFRNQERWAIGR